MTFSTALFFWCLVMSFRAHSHNSGRAMLVPSCVSPSPVQDQNCGILPQWLCHLNQREEREGMWSERESHTPNWAVHGYQFHGSWRRWGHFPLILRNKIKFKRQFCTFWGCCAPAPCRRKAGDVVLIFQCAGGSDMFWALLKREQMLHNCNRKSRMLLYITDFPQCFGKDHWPKQM